MHLSEILIKPILSEKSTALSEQSKPHYVFKVALKANKPMIQKAIKERYNVVPEDVRVINQRGDWKRVRREYGLTARSKKAIVTLKRGEKIDLFEADN